MERPDIWVVSEEEVSRLGVPMTLKGYYYLVIAVVLSVKYGLIKAALIKEIYMKIAEMEEVSWFSVEKDIRNCLVKAWKDEKGPFRNTYPGRVGMPTNSEVIAYITSRIRVETTLRI